MLNPYAAIVTLVTFAQDRMERVKNEKGATAVEYGLMVGLIAVVIIAAVVALGGRLDVLFRSIVTSLGGTVPA